MMRKATAEWAPFFVRIDMQDLGVWQDPIRSKSRTFFGNSFIDFSKLDWDGLVGKNRSNALVLMDDHVDQLTRMEQARRLGFGHLVYDDNYSEC